MNCSSSSKQVCLLLYLYKLKQECFHVHLEASVHQDVHVGSAADGSFLTSSLRGRRQEQTAGGRQSGVWGRFS